MDASSFNEVGYIYKFVMSVLDTVFADGDDGAAVHGRLPITAGAGLASEHEFNSLIIHHKVVAVVMTDQYMGNETVVFEYGEDTIFKGVAGD